MTALLVLLVSLSQKAPPPPSTVKPPPVVVVRGEKLKGLPAVELTKLLATPSEFDGKEIALRGTVRKACTRKGCWMELSQSENSPGVRVTFKDYGFFVPLDSAGSSAAVEGLVKVTTLSAEKAKHYESEGAKVPQEKDGTYKEVQLVAVGVSLERKAQEK